MERNGSAFFSTDGRNLASTTVSAIVDRDAYKKAGLGELNYAHNIAISSKHREFLKKQGINVPSGAREISYLSPDVINSGLISGSKTVVHEIGHSATKRSGKYYEKVTKPRQLFDDSVRSISGSASINLEKFSEIFDSYLNAMQAHGFEEGRADSFAVENLQRGMSKKGMSADSISTTFNEFSSGYSKAGGFENYSSRFELDLENTIQKLGRSINDVEGPISGKQNLTPKQLLKEITMKGRVKASGTYGGVLKNISGPAGEGISKSVDSSILLMKNYAEETLGPIESSRVSGILDESLEAAKGHRVLMEKPDAAVARIASQVPYTERLVAAAPEVSSDISRSSARFLSSARQTSKAVTLGKRRI